MPPLTQQFHEAVLVLAGNGPVKQRLIAAYTQHLDEIDEEDLPQALVAEFSKLHGRLHGVAPANGEGPVRASVLKMSVPEAAECARSIVQLHVALVRHEAGDVKGSSLHLVPAPEVEPVPEFLLKS